MRLACILLGALSLGGAGACRGDACVPAGDVLARADEIAAFAVDDQQVVFGALSDAFEVEIWQVARGGGDTELLARRDGEQASPPEVLATDDQHVYWLEPCGPPGPAECQRLLRAPRDGGGEVDLVLEDRVFSFVLDGGLIYYTTSDERGLGEGDPGGVWSRPKDGGGEATELAGDLRHLRELFVDGDAIYTSDVIGEGEQRIGRLLRVPRDGGPAEVLAEMSGAGGARPTPLALGDGALVYHHPLDGLFALELGPDGAAVDPTFLMAPANWLAGIAVDAGRVFVTDPGRYEGTTDDSQGTYVCGGIAQISLDGGPVTTVSPEERQPTRIAVSRGELFWHSDELAEADDTLRRMALLAPSARR